MNVKKILAPTVSLFVICLAASMLLAFTNLFTKDKIAAAARQAELEQRAVVLPEAGYYEEKIDYVIGYDKQGGNVVGYVITASGKGYGGNITVMVGFSDGAICGITVLEQSETQGVGTKTALPSYLEQYIGKTSGTTLGTDVDAVTGATVSSRAVNTAVNIAFEIYERVKRGDAQ